MGWTKGQLITAAFDELGLAEYVFDLSPEQIQSALLRQDLMIAGWKEVNIHWPFEAPSDIDFNTDTNCPHYAARAIILNDAIELAPSYGKVVSKDTIKNAKEAYDTLVSWSIDLPPTRQMPGMLSGAGNKSWRSTGNIMTTQTEDVLIKKGGSEITF